LPPKGQTLAVIGGGAAGFFAAITAAEANPRLRVVVLEKSRQLLAKVKVSGGGRCNVTTSITDPALVVGYYPRGGLALRGPFTRFGPRDTAAWFEKRGVRLKTEADGRVFPITNDSQTIIDCLLQAARSAGVEIWAGALIENLERSQNQFTITLKDSPALQADQVLIASGSNHQGHAWAKSLGHSIVPPVPSLFTFNVKDPRLEGLAGVSVAKTELQIGKQTQIGPTLITHWGLSGPGVLKLSAWGARDLAQAGYKAELILNWLPDTSDEQVRQLITKARNDHPKQIVALRTLVPLIPQRLWERLVAGAGIETAARRWGELSKAEVAALIDQLRRGHYAITGKGVFKEEFVTCGGVQLDEVNFKTMESKRCPGLYFAGEVLDIDGLTGGFNFQSAWTTGWLAGNAMAHNKV
jgi:predicted Rossmann fold flavoprotein